MKTNLFVALSLLVVVSAQAKAQDEKKLTPSITVVGAGEASAKPDMARIQVGVTTQAETAAAALKANTVSMEALFKVLQDRKIDKNDIQTSNFNVHPVYKQIPRGEMPRGERSQTIVGYQVTNQVSIKVRDLANLGGVLDDVVGKGANQVHGISFSKAEPSPILDQARLKAMADARRKAELYAGAAGVEVGKVLLIQEATPHVPQQQMFAGAALARGADSSVPVAPGQQTYHSNITVTYSIK
jgi:uncharacterized protein YggE